MKRKHLFTDYGTWSRWKISTNSLTILFFRAIPVGEFTAEPPPPVQMSLRLPAARSMSHGARHGVTQLFSNAKAKIRTYSRTSKFST